MSDIEFTVAANSKPFRQELGRMEVMMEEFGGKISKELAKSFGIGFLATQGVRLIKGAFDNAEKVSDAARKWKMTTDEVQLLTVAADEAGQSLDEYLNNAKTGAIDLAKVIRQMRERNDLSIISETDIRTLAKDKERIQRLGQGAVNRTSTIFGTLLGMAESLGTGNFGEYAAHLARTGQFMPLPFPLNVGAQWLAGDANKKLNAPNKRQQGWMPLPWDMFTISRFVLENRLRGLEDTEYAMGRADKSKGSLYNLNRTDWQQIGAAVTRPDMVMSESNQKLDEIRDEIRDIRRQIEKLKI